MLTLFASQACAQVTPLENVVEDLYQDGKALVISPLKWQKRDRIIALSFLGATALALTTDQKTQNFFARNRTDFSNRTADFFRPIGDKLPFWALGGFYASGLVLKDQKAKETAYLGLKSIFFSQTITRGLKYGFGRARPFAEKGAYYFKPFDFSPPDNSLSLPSGHATTAFALASVVGHQYPQWYVKYPVYLLAAGVAWSRCNDNVHFLSDVVIGGGIGYFIGEKIVYRHQEQARSRNP